MKLFKKYDSILKTQLFKLGGFIIKKETKTIFKGLNSNTNLSFILITKKASYNLFNPTVTLFQLLNVFKFYSDLILVNNNLIITTFLSKSIISLPINSVTKTNFFIFPKFIGGLFSNYSTVLWSFLRKKTKCFKGHSSLVIIFNSVLQNTISKDLYVLGVPTIGFYSYKSNSNYLTYPIFLDNNLYILYFFVRLFLRLLFILKFKL